MADSITLSIWEEASAEADEAKELADGMPAGEDGFELTPDSVRELRRAAALLAQANASVLARIDRSLRASGVAVPYDGHAAADGDLAVVFNNLANMGGAAAKGFGTGLTFGLVGNHVTDNYEITFRLTQPSGGEELKYQHAIMTTVGNASGPPGVTAVGLASALDQVIDDVVLNFLKDTQADGRLRPR
jgi:hypothetical protein